MVLCGGLTFLIFLWWIRGLKIQPPQTLITAQAEDICNCVNSRATSKNVWVIISEVALSEFSGEIDLQEGSVFFLSQFDIHGRVHQAAQPISQLIVPVIIQNNLQAFTLPSREWFADEFILEGLMNNIRQKSE